MIKPKMEADARIRSSGDFETLAGCMTEPGYTMTLAHYAMYRGRIAALRQLRIVDRGTYSHPFPSALGICVEAKLSRKLSQLLDMLLENRIGWACSPHFLIRVISKSGRESRESRGRSRYSPINRNLVEPSTKDSAGFFVP